MQEATRPDRMVTPEAVSVTLDIAGLGSRLIAAIIDGLIQGVVTVGLGVLFLGALGAGDQGGGTAGLVVFLILAFLTTWGYFPLFEGLWNGRTPGKRLQRIRVVRTDGQPVTAGPVLVRNLVRLVDWLPFYYAVGAICMMVTSRSQRLGDLAAGTIVIRERPLPEPEALSLSPDHAGSEAALDTSAVTEREYALIRSFLQRRNSLTPVARRELATQLAASFRPRVGAAERPTEDDESFLETVLLSYRRRFTDPGAESTAAAAPLLPPPP